MRLRNLWVNKKIQNETKTKKLTRNAQIVASRESHRSGHISLLQHRSCIIDEHESGFDPRGGGSHFEHHEILVDAQTGRLGPRDTRGRRGEIRQPSDALDALRGPRATEGIETSALQGTGAEVVRSRQTERHFHESQIARHVD